MLWLENQSFLPFLTIILFCFFLVIHLLLILLPSSRKIQDEESIALLLHSFLWSRYYLQTRESTE
jgi:preprotein translocase subunit SecG